MNVIYGKDSYCGTDFRVISLGESNLKAYTVDENNIFLYCNQISCVGNSLLTITQGFYYEN